MIPITPSINTRAVKRLLDRTRRVDPVVERRVAAIVETVRRRGDSALVEYARKFDGLRGSIEVTQKEILQGAALTPRPVREALAAAARNITKVAIRQVPRTQTTTVRPGVVVEQRVTALDRVGCYVPGGRYPLPSSLLMTAIPARAAGVAEIIAVCPRPEPVVLAAAAEAGATRLFRIGGAHAIAALAYGTETVPCVDKIVGPGNAYVAAAKTLVSRDCAIDVHAGPSEIVIVTGDGRPEWIAADLIAQAEHDPDARAILLTWSRPLAQMVRREIGAQLPRSGPARLALERNGSLIVTRDLGEAIDLANRIAPEHLVCDDERVVSGVTRAGAIFVGAYTAQAAGDYATGSNHVLPTGGAARSRGGLSAADFVRVTSVQRLTSRGLKALAPTVVTLARAEGLEAHARSVELRTRSLR